MRDIDSVGRAERRKRESDLEREVIKERHNQKDRWDTQTAQNRSRRSVMVVERILFSVLFTLLSDYFRCEEERISTYCEGLGPIHTLAVSHVGQLDKTKRNE